MNKILPNEMPSSVCNQEIIWQRDGVDSTREADVELTARFISTREPNNVTFPSALKLLSLFYKVFGRLHLKKDKL